MPLPVANDSQPQPPPTTCGVPVACLIGQSSVVSDGNSRTRRSLSELCACWSGRLYPQPSKLVMVDSGSVRKTWRCLLRGPKHGIARGTAVYGSRGFEHDPDHVAAALSSCQRLHDWARDQQINLDDDPVSLAALDRTLDQRRDEAMSVLKNEAGLYLGAVMVRNLWHGSMARLAERASGRAAILRPDV